jgi:hypothetical protein
MTGRDAIGFHIVTGFLGAGKTTEPTYSRARWLSGAARSATAPTGAGRKSLLLNRLHRLIIMP